MSNFRGSYLEGLFLSTFWGGINVAVLGKIFGEAWPLIIWEATTAKRNLLQNQLMQPVAELLCPKIWVRAGQDWGGGAVPPGPT